MRSFYDLMGTAPATHDEENSFVTSWLLPPALLASFRLLLSLYCFSSEIYTWSYYGTHDDITSIGRSFSYFTDLTWWGLAFYFLVSGMHTACYAATGHNRLQRWPKSLRLLHNLFYTTIVTFPFLVTIVYWTILHRDKWFSDTFDAWNNVSHHAMNSLFAFFEIMMVATGPPPLLHQPFLWILLLLYLGLAYLTHAVQGWYPYNFLDINKQGSGSVTAYIFGILAAIVVIFLVVWILILLRRKITGTGKRSKYDPITQRTDLEMFMTVK